MSLKEFPDQPQNKRSRVLIEKGADVNAVLVPSSRDTALTIVAYKGHYRFVELLLQYGALVDKKDKKGNSPLWLACNGGHLEVVQLLVNAKADIDSQNNRKISCLMAAFRKGHVEVVKFMVKHVNQFPSDTECLRFIATISDKKLSKKCHQCMEIIVTAKDRKAAEANRIANELLEELESEESKKENKKAAAAPRQKKKKKSKKREKKAVKPANDQSQEPEEEDDEEDEKTPAQKAPSVTTTTTFGKVRTTDTVAPQSSNRKEKALTKTSVVASTKESEKNEKNEVKRSKKNDRGRRKGPLKDTKANSNRHIEKPIQRDNTSLIHLGVQSTPFSVTETTTTRTYNLFSDASSMASTDIWASPRSSTELSSPVLSNDTNGLSDRKLRAIGSERSRQQQRRTPTAFSTLPSGIELGNSIWSYKPGDGGNSWLHTSPQSVEENLLKNQKLPTSGVIGRRTNVDGGFHMNAAMMVWSDWSSTM